MHLQLKLSVLVLFLCSFVTASAQTTAVTATITDSDSTVWTNATVYVSFQPNPAQPSLNSYTLGGVKLTSATYSSYLQQSVVTNGSGTLAVTLLDNSLITPAGSKWYFIIQSNTSAQAVTYVPISVSGASQSLTSFLSAGTIAPRFPAINQAFGYTDAEVHPIPQPGGQYFNIVNNIQRIWNGSSWQNGAGGGSTIPATNAVLCGSGSANSSIACTPGTQYVAPNGSITGQAGTALALSANPSLCSTGYAPVGILANGSATGCAPLSGTSTPTGAAGGALSGSYPNPTINGTIISPKVINGTSYSNLYSGALAERINACVADALSLTNGNTSGTCDSTGESIARTSYDEPLTVGNASGTSMLWKTPCGATWVANFSNTLDAALYWYSGAVIKSDCHGSSGGTIFTISSTASLGYLVYIAASATPYLAGSGLEFINVAGGHTTATNVGVQLQGVFADGSTLHGVNVYDSLDLNPVESTGACCGFTWEDSSINAGGYGTPLFLRTDSSGYGPPNQAFTFRDGSIVDPGVGKPAIFCQDTSSTPNFSVASITEVYTETNPADATGSAYYQVDGCAQVDFTNDTFASNSANNAEPGISYTTRGHSSITVNNLRFIPSTGTWSYPIKAVVPPTTPPFITNYNGSFAGHFSNDTYWQSDGSGNTTYGQGAGINMVAGSAQQNTFFGQGAGYTCTTCQASGAFGYNSSLAPGTSDAYQIGGGTNSLNNSLQFFGINFLTTAGLMTPTNLQVSNVATSPSTSPICPNGTGGQFTTSGCSSTSPIFTHFPTGATPTLLVNSVSNPAIDVNYVIMSSNITSITLPAFTAVADGETIKVIASQPATGGPYTLPTYTTASSPFAAGSGTTIVTNVQGGCPVIGTTVSGTAPSQLYIELVYRASITQYQIVQCISTPAQYSQGGTLSANGQAGVYSTGTVLNSTLMPLAGHFTNLEIVYGGGGCTTAPYLNVFASIPNGTPAYGTPGQGSTTTQTPGQGVDTPETLPFAAGQRAGIEVSTGASACGASYYSINAQYVFSNNSN